MIFHCFPTWWDFIKTWRIYRWMGIHWRWSAELLLTKDHLEWWLTSEINSTQMLIPRLNLGLWSWMTPSRTREHSSMLRSINRSLSINRMLMGIKRYRIHTKLRLRPSTSNQFNWKNHLVDNSSTQANTHLRSQVPLLLNSLLVQLEVDLVSRMRLRSWSHIGSRSGSRFHNHKRRLMKTFLCQESRWMRWKNPSENCRQKWGMLISRLRISFEPNLSRNELFSLAKS